MTAEQVLFVQKCIDDNYLIRFYTWAPWLHLRSDVLDDDKHECQMCKRRGRYTKATHVHHVKHVRRHPELALVKTLPDGARQLISLCQACHELCHPERMRRKPKKKYWPERWD